MNINLIYIKLRKTQIAILKLNDDGTYTILVNNIIHDDMYSNANVDLIERMAHARQFDDVEGINFYAHIL